MAALFGMIITDPSAAIGAIAHRISPARKTKGVLDVGDLHDLAIECHSIIMLHIQSSYRQLHVSD